jgi:hypothetical protein
MRKITDIAGDSQNAAPRATTACRWRRVARGKDAAAEIDVRLTV